MWLKNFGVIVLACNFLCENFQHRNKVDYGCLLSVCVSGILSPKPQSRSESIKKWEHDLYVEEEQKPRTQWEKDRVSGIEELSLLC